MKIDLSLVDAESFMVHPHMIASTQCFLIQPQHIGCKWTRENCIFRSSVWDSEGNPVSLSFKKFVNWGEKPEVFPLPKNLDDCEVMEKMDGSTLICSLYKGELILRTRGTVNARKLDNGHEIDVILQKYPIEKMLRDKDALGLKMTFIFEWVSSENTIVIKYPETPDVILIGAVFHDCSYSYASQDTLDIVAKDYGLKRPKRYTFDSFEKLLRDVEAFQGIEGVCIYHSNGQEIHKVKASAYLALHRFKEHANIETTVDLFFELEIPKYSEFEEKLIEKFDYECFSLVRGFASNICEAFKEVNKIILAMEEKVANVKSLTRRMAAQYILQAYGETNRASMAFTLLDGKKLSKEQIKKLLYQCLKD